MNGKTSNIPPTLSHFLLTPLATQSWSNTSSWRKKNKFKKSDTCIRKNSHTHFHIRYIHIWISHTHSHMLTYRLIIWLLTSKQSPAHGNQQMINWITLINISFTLSHTYIYLVQQRAQNSTNGTWRSAKKCANGLH